MRGNTKSLGYSELVGFHWDAAHFPAQKRMKLEISYAGDTSTLLPKVDPLFKIRKVDLKGKQRDKTASEFGEALAVLLGRKAGRRAMDYSTFRDCLTTMVA